MRLFPVLTAILVVFSLYMLVFERDALIAFADAEPQAETGEQPIDQTDPDAVAVVAMTSVAEEIERVVLTRGRTEAARQVEVRAETSGKVVSDPQRKGALVMEGDLLCELDPGTRAVSLANAEAQLAQARASLPEAEARRQEARARLDEAQINFNAADQLSADGFASETRVANARAAVESARAGVQSAEAGLESARAAVQAAEAQVAAAETEIERLKITSPFDGILESDAAELGALLQPGSPCATVIQLSPIKLVGFVPETEVDRVEVGAEAGARLASGRQVRGEVIFLSRSADPQTRTFRVEVSVPNDDLTIRDGQTAEILIRSQSQKAHLVPQSSLTLDDDGTLGVRTVDDTDHVAFMTVEVLRDATNGVYVSGLPETVDIIVVGQEYVSAGVAVRPTYREMTQ